jgi:DNA invertase Pin-like site-specific DNA recombinase
MKYFIYCRKSSEEDSRQTQSLDTQQRILLDLASNLNLEIVDIIKESKSARSDQNRPLFTNMLDRITKGDADAVLVVHTDRLARNFIDAGFIIKFIEQGVLKEVRTPTSVFNNVPSLMYMGFDFVFASHYSRDLSVKVKAGNESKLLKGEYPSYAPIGYINIKPGNGIEPDPIRAPFIKRAFELFSTRDYSAKTLSRKLYEEGFRSRNGKKEHASQIHRMLINPEYYGVIRRKGKLYTGKHRPLISKSLFDQAQEIFLDKSRPKKQTYDFIFRDFLVCENCGCKVTAGISKGKYIYYRCTNGKGSCDQHKKYWSTDKVKTEFQEFFSNFTLDPKRAGESFELYKKKMLEEFGQKTNSNVAIEEQIRNLKTKLLRLEDMYIDGKISTDRFDERKTEIQNELVQLKVIKKQQNKREVGTTLELVEEVKNKAVQLSFLFEHGDDGVKKDLMRSLLWKSNFLDGKITSTRLTKLWKPLENLNKTNDIEKWRSTWVWNQCVIITVPF